MGCDLERDACRERDIAPRLADARRDGPDFEARCPECGHGGFRISRPATGMRNVWTCNCKICNGGKGCPVTVTRAAMIRKGIPVRCLGSYIGKHRREVPEDAARKMAQTIDDILNCPTLKAAEIRILLADARGDKMPAEYGPCAAYLMSIGLGRSNAYNFAELETGGRPPDESPPQGGGGKSTPVVPQEGRIVSNP